MNKPEATKTSFDAEGWFRTGDIAVLSNEGDYRLLGRSSSDMDYQGRELLLILRFMSAPVCITCRRNGRRATVDCQRSLLVREMSDNLHIKHDARAFSMSMYCTHHG